MCVCVCVCVCARARACAAVCVHTFEVCQFYTCINSKFRFVDLGYAEFCLESRIYDISCYLNGNHGPREYEDLHTSPPR